MIDTKILQEAIDIWGADAQIEMIIEECAELIFSITED